MAWSLISVRSVASFMSSVSKCEFNSLVCSIMNLSSLGTYLSGRVALRNSSIILLTRMGT